MKSNDSLDGLPDTEAERGGAAARRPWSAPMVIIATLPKATNKASDYDPEGHIPSGSTTVS